MKILTMSALSLTLLCPGLAHSSREDLKKTTTKDFLLSTAKSGCMPKGVKVDPVGQYLFVAEMCGKVDSTSKIRVPTASIFSMETRTLSKTIVTPVGMRKGGILANTEVDFSLDEKWAMITRAEGDAGSEVFKNQALLSVVSNETHNIVKYVPLRGSGAKIIATRPFVPDDEHSRQIVYVANYFSDDLSVVDVTELKDDGNLDGSAHFKEKVVLATNFKNPQSRGYFIAPRGVAFSSDGRYALILATETGSIIIVDAIKHRQIAELAPIDPKTAGRELNVRHIVVSHNGKMAYLSHMRGNAISRISMVKLIQAIKKLPRQGKDVTLPSELWDDLFVPFKSAAGEKKILVLEDYPLDHPNFAGKKWELAHPNTIVLDPKRNRYLYVSHRTTSNKDYTKVDPSIMGKIDIIDLEKDQLVYSLVGGSQPTALDVSRDGRTLVSSGFMNDKLYFFDLEKILHLYER